MSARDHLSDVLNHVDQAHFDHSRVAVSLKHLLNALHLQHAPQLTFAQANLIFGSSRAHRFELGQSLGRCIQFDRAVLGLRCRHRSHHNL